MPDHGGTGLDIRRADRQSAHRSAAADRDGGSTTAPIPPVGYAGTERVVAALADGLAARGHHVTLFASGDSTAGSAVIPVVPRAIWLDGYRSEVAPFVTMSAAAAWAHAREFDVLHAHLETLGLPLARHVGVPVLTTFHQRLDLPGILRLPRCLPGRAGGGHQ